MTRSLSFAALALLLAAAPSTAAPLGPVAYDMRNGHGQASGGTFNYWDRNYTGLGLTNTDNALLSGGVGDLTDGVIPTQNWFLVENSAGTGPYVGWRSAVNPLPSVTFRFGSTVLLNSVAVYVDDSDGAGGVSVPLSVDVGVAGGPYTNFALIDPAGPAPTSFTFSGLGLSGTAFDVRFHYRNIWVFVSEVTFDGRPTAVPEPASLSMLGGGLLGLAAGIRSRRRK